GARDFARITGHDNRLIMAAVARRALEGLGGRVQIARTVVNNGDAHIRRSASGNRPITSLPTAAAAAGTTTGRGGTTGACSTHRVKNRRSASSRLRALTTAIVDQRRRA